MRRALFLGLAFAWAGAAAAAERDPYAVPPAPPGSIEGLLEGARHGRVGGEAALEAWLRDHQGADPELLGRVYDRLCQNYGVRSWNAQRARACKAQNALADKTQGDDDVAMSAVVAEVPPVHAVGSARAPLIWNTFGSQSAMVSVNGVAVPWFIDTGAEISVVTQSVADRIGVRYLSQSVQVGTSTADVDGKVGVIDLMTIGAASVENVTVLVLPDAQLTIGGVHTIPAILGLPVFVAFRRMAWTNGGTVLALGEAAPRPAPGSPAIYWDDDGVGVPVETPLGVRGANLDTGANTTDWWSSGRALLTEAQLAAATEHKARVGGAGGVVEVMEKTLASLSFRLAGRPVEIKKLSLGEGPKGQAARIGMDAVSQFGTFILDFETMRVGAVLKTPKERARKSWRALTQDDVKLDEPKAPPVAAH